jgi:hypothetical protein
LVSISDLRKGAAAPFLFLWCASCSAFSILVWIHVNGHGGAEHHMTTTERVAGYRCGWMIQTHLPPKQACMLLEKLKRDFAGSEIHYWMTPLIVAGNLS